MGGYRDYDDEDRAGDLPEDPKRMWKSLNMIFKYLLCGFTALIGLAALLFVLAFLTWFTGRAIAAEPPASVQVSCDSLASFAWAMASYRDVDANQEKIIEMVRGNFQNAPPGVEQVLIREIQRVWKEKRTADEAAESAYERCVTGTLGAEG